MGRGVCWPLPGAPQHPARGGWNNSGWKRALRSSSPTVGLALPSPPLSPEHRGAWWSTALHLNEGPGVRGGQHKYQRKGIQGSLRRGPARPLAYRRHFFFFYSWGGWDHLMSLFFPFVWPCQQPSVTAWPLSSPSLSPPSLPTPDPPGNFPMEEKPRGGGGGKQPQLRGCRRKEGKKKPQHNSLASSDKKGP